MPVIGVKEGGKAELRDVSIVVYGRQSNRYDQIYGDDFAYDPKTGEWRIWWLDGRTPGRLDWAGADESFCQFTAELSALR